MRKRKGVREREKEREKTGALAPFSYLVYNNSLRSIINVCFYDNFSTPLSIKALALLLKLDSLSIQTQASSLGILITFGNNFCFI